MKITLIDNDGTALDEIDIEGDPEQIRDAIRSALESARFFECDSCHGFYPESHAVEFAGEPNLYCGICHDEISASRAENAKIDADIESGEEKSA